ncbi:hypothetical protein J2Z62_000497 [Mycoplasmoides fastidiosum]|uniref:DUF31 domain-containing protein n=1 Tax=Mycoplasmoides fastidiosum TaxID=92758 RepID=A0ABU0LZC5_9BACT|nr:hypothetical protein [Mycoplasmoides fastidiosum]MDQ0514059.1 hypothetical protein [Mycoplasmoides fastidiosum]UUD37530.1 hypothetical protein NPA10_03105 [Mycoplasmoides fastidiosum]
MKFTSWKWNSLSRRLKFFIPLTLLTVSVGAAAGYLVSPSGSSLFISNSSLEAGYDQNFRVPIFKNQYADFENATGNLQVIQKPNLKASQSLELVDPNNFTIQTLAANSSFQIGQLSSVVRQSAVGNSVDLFKMSFTKEQFERVFKNRKSPDLGFLFKLKFSAYDSASATTKTVAYDKGLITGFSLDDLNLVKSRKYRVFDYSVNDDYYDLQGTISAVMEMSIDKRGNFGVTISLNAENLKTQTLSDNPKLNQFHVDFESLGNNQIFKPIIFWNVNASNDLDSWYWPNPRGPIQNPEVRVPLSQNNAIVAPTDYTVTLHDDGAHKYQYQLVNDFEKLATNPTATEQPKELATLKFSNQEWQTNFFNNWGKDMGIAKDPGAQVKFDLNFDARDGEYGQKQLYKTSVFGYFNFSSLRNGAVVNQEIVKYDLSDGRVKNFGTFKVLLWARVNLYGDLIIKLSSVTENLSYQSSEFANDIASSDFNSSVKFSNFEVSRFYDGQDSKETIDQKAIGPNRVFNRNVSHANIKTVNSSIRDALNGNNARGRNMRTSWGWWSTQPYLFHYNRVWSTEQTEDISSYVENDPFFAQKTDITFRFGGTVESNNRTDIVLDTPGNARIMNLGKDNVNVSDEQAEQRKIVGRANSTNDPYTQFTIPFSEIGKKANGDNFWFKRLYAFDRQEYRYNYLDRYLFNFQNQNTNNNRSMIRVIYYIKLTKVSDFIFKYRIGMDASTYQWSKGDSAASRGRAGIKLEDITYTIKE